MNLNNIMALEKDITLTEENKNIFNDWLSLLENLENKANKYKEELNHLKELSDWINSFEKMLSMTYDFSSIGSSEVELCLWEDEEEEFLKNGCRLKELFKSHGISFHTDFKKISEDESGVSWYRYHFFFSTFNGIGNYFEHLTTNVFSLLSMTPKKEFDYSDYDGITKNIVLLSFLEHIGFLNFYEDDVDINDESFINYLEKVKQGRKVNYSMLLDLQNSQKESYVSALCKNIHICREVDMNKVDLAFQKLSQDEDLKETIEKWIESFTYVLDATSENISELEY